MSLNNMQEGQIVSVVQVRLDSGRKSRLQAMGLVPGTRLTILASSLFGASVVFCRGSKLVLGKEIGERIEVRL
ncbi:MAG: FeoA family protein [Planctomycetia bacterium]|nr:FeoA family protein [Planctomycetia bacterium]